MLVLTSEPAASLWEFPRVWMSNLSRQEDLRDGRGPAVRPLLYLPRLGVIGCAVRLDHAACMAATDTAATTTVDSDHLSVWPTISVANQ